MGNNSRNRKYSLNEHYFEKIDTKEKAYILGFIYADGNLKDTDGYYRLAFSQHPQDREILEYIKNQLNYSGPIRYDRSQVDKRNGQTYYHDRLQINSKDLIKDLNKHGVMQRKSLILKAPLIEQEFIGSFIRGYFDGDGTVGLYKKGPILVFLGTLELLSWINGYAKNGNIYPNGNIYSLNYTSRKSITPLIELMSESPFSMLRKTEKLDAIMVYLEGSSERMRMGHKKAWKTQRAKKNITPLPLPKTIL